MLSLMQRCCYAVVLVDFILLDVKFDVKGTYDFVRKLGNTTKVTWLDTIRVEVLASLALAVNGAGHSHECDVDT